MSGLVMIEGEKTFGISPDFIRKSMRRSFRIGKCNTKKIARHFLCFPPNFEGFFAFGHKPATDIRMARLIGGNLRFEPIEANALPKTTITDGGWYLIKNIASHAQHIANNYRKMCDQLGIDDQGEITAYAHGKGVHAPRHTDLSGGLIVMLQGYREWRAEPPVNSGDGIFDPLSPLDWGDGFSHGVEALKIGPGEVAYIPGGWWHETRSLTPSLTFRIGLAERTKSSGPLAKED